MDRVFSVFLSSTSLILTMLILSPVQAEVILKSADYQRAVGDGEYPPSRFGSEPADPFADDMPSRSPAAANDPNHLAAVKSEGQALVPNMRHGVQEIALIAGDLGYFPRTVFVTRDIPVRLYVTGASASTLCIMIDSFNIRKQIRSSAIEEIMFTPSVPGQYRYYCPVNGMEGTLVVKEIKG